MGQKQQQRRLTARTQSQRVGSVVLCRRVAAADESALLQMLSYCVGLPVAPKCTERALEIANAIQGPYELVVLQEIWHKRERNLIISRAKEAGYHYYHYFNAAVGFPVPLGPDSFGTGLLALSKFPIVDVMYHSFSLSGRPYALHEVQNHVPFDAVMD